MAKSEGNVTTCLDHYHAALICLLEGILRSSFPAGRVRLGAWFAEQDARLCLQDRRDRRADLWHDGPHRARPHRTPNRGDPLNDGGLRDHELGGSFEVILLDQLLVSGAVLADQVKSIDRHVRRIEFAGKVPDSFVQDVQARIGPLLGLD